MLFSTQVAAILAMALAGTQAYPSADPSPAIGDLVVVGVESTPAGPLTFYGESNPSPGLSLRDDSILDARATCTNEIKYCNGEAGGSHKGPKPVCKNLLDALDKNMDKLPKSPRSICLGTEKGGRCCVSWNKVPNRYNELKRKAMAEPGRKIYEACDKHGETTISGMDVSAGFFGECIRVCLSNRPDGCA